MSELNFPVLSAIDRFLTKYVINLFALFFCGASYAEALPPHSVSFSPEDADCAVSFIPDATSGNNPPQLEIIVNMLSQRLSLSLIGDVYKDQVFLWGNTRTQFSEMRNIESKDLVEDELWLALQQAELEKEPVYWTVQDTNDGYSSARYNNLSPDQIARTLALACNLNNINAPTPTEIEALQTEKRLNLSDESVRYIRRVLFSLYGEQGAEPGEGRDLTLTDRRLIGMYNSEHEISAGEYLTAAAAAELLQKKPTLRMPDQEKGSVEKSIHVDWRLTIQGEGTTCTITTPAKATAGYTGTTLPLMRFSASRSGSGGLIAIDLSQPNIFAPAAPVRAVIDGSSIELMIESTTGALVPRPLADGRLSNDFTVKLRRGREIMIEGVSRETGKPMMITYSALGFTAAFRDMSESCDRAGILGWIR